MKNNCGGDPAFLVILDEVREMHCKKGADTFANVRASEEFGVPAWKGAILRANDKMARLKTFRNKGALVNESVEGSLLDLANYAMIALRLYREAYDIEPLRIAERDSSGNDDSVNGWSLTTAPSPIIE